jgi:hypothetical protein
MGEVYLAKDLRLERTIALKVLSADVSSDKRRMQRFRQEAKVASSLNQPNILTIFEFGEVDGLTFLATEFIDGETLRDYLRGKRLKLPETLDIAIQVLAALDAAHEARIVHRDIKPENVMIRRRDRVVKVLDFGLAKLTEKRSLALTDQESEAVTAFKTAPGILMGTINYMSPEQAQSRAVDERTDIWSAGVMLYEMVTGVMPFGGPTSSHTLVQIIEQEPAPLTKAVAGQVPPELQRIIRKALAKTPDERYQSAKDMLIDLKSLRKQLDVRVGTTDDTDRRTDKKRVLVIALVVMAIVTAGIFAVNFWRASRRGSAAAVSTPAPVAAPAVAAGPERTLTYSITVQELRNGKREEPYTMAAEVSFEPGDWIRFNVSSPQAGHLYVLNEGPRQGTVVPEYNILFPSPTANKGSSLLKADQEVHLPEKTSWKFDEETGVERLWLVFAEEAVAELEGAKRFASPRTAGSITDPAQNKRIQDFLTSNSATKPVVDKSETVSTLKMPGKLLVYPIRLEHH